MKILFIGNSYTYYNDMPALFADECEKNGVSADVYSVTAGGYELERFLSEGNEYGQRIKQLLSDIKFDYIIIQEQSVYPVVMPDAFFKSVSEFCRMIRANGAKPILYETWGRADGNETLSRLGMSHDEMQAKLRSAYETAAKNNDVIPVYAGDRFHEAYREGKDVFDPDGSHPSPSGSLIVAKEFCRVLTDK